MPETQSSNVIEIERLRLAAWMQLNGQELLERRLGVGGKMVYVFRRSEITNDIVKKWDVKAPSEVALARFSRIVSSEIQRAVRMRRAAGLPTRITSSEMS